ncbi:MAG: nucleotidyltransferase domain-containing protein, partial [Bacteroidota bacterium]|nr:nucleotidyltransferase domain-containing protein [Bacteroidota bacterium]
MKRAAAIARKYLSDVQGVEFFLFGSRASGKYHDRSDYDFGITVSSKLDIKKFWALKDELENIPVLQQIELVDFSRVSRSFRVLASKN